MTAFYRKYRPQKFADVVGHDAIKQLLQKAIFEDSPAHAYLFSGPRGVGKTTLARLISRALNCEKPDKGDPCGKCGACKAVTIGNFPDVIEIDAASNRGIDEIRALREKVAFPPMQGKYKVYIIDEVHMLTREAFNALLKTLEEPPKHVVFILCTTEPHKLPDTIISRCQWFELHLASADQLVEKLKRIAKREKVKVDPAVYALVARVARGSFRDGETLFESLVGMTKKGKKVSLKEAREVLNVPSDVVTAGLVDSAMKGDSKTTLKKLAKAKDRGYGAERLLDELLVLCRDRMMDSIGSDSTEFYAKLMNALLGAKKNIPLLPDAYVALELAFVDLLGTSAEQPKDLEGVTDKEEEVSASKPKDVDEVEETPEPTSKWKDVVLAIEKANCQLASIMSSARVSRGGDGSLSVSVGSSFEESIVGAPKTRKILNDAIKKVYGNAVALKCMVVKGGGKGVVDVDVRDLGNVFDGDVK